MDRTVVFHNGLKMPLLGLGTWQSLDPAELENALNEALTAGYRHIDTAYIYNNENVIGKVLQEWFKSGKLRREEIFITTKLPLCGMTPNLVRHFLHLSLKSLQLEYVDLYLIHAPMGLQYQNDETPFPFENGKALLDNTTDHMAIWKALEVEVEAGSVKAIGLSNFNLEQVRRVYNSATIPPANIQNEIHAYLQEQPLIDYCVVNGITVCAYAPIGSPGRVPFFKKIGIPHGVDDPGLLADQTVETIAKAYGKSPAQILLRFLVQQNIVVIPKSVRAERIRENISIFDFSLSDGDISQLKSLDRGERGRTFRFAALGAENHPEFPFPIVAAE